MLAISRFNQFWWDPRGWDYRFDDLHKNQRDISSWGTSAIHHIELAKICTEIGQRVRIAIMGSSFEKEIFVKSIAPRYWGDSSMLIKLQ